MHENEPIKLMRSTHSEPRGVQASTAILSCIGDATSSTTSAAQTRSPAHAPASHPLLFECVSSNWKEQDDPMVLFRGHQLALDRTLRRLTSDRADGS